MAEVKADPAMNDMPAPPRNGTPSGADRFDDDWAGGDIFLDLDEEGKAALADGAWIDEQRNKGALEAFRGEYVAVVGKTLLGHNKSLKKLREDVVAATGHSVDRIVTSFIAPRGR